MAGRVWLIVEGQHDGEIIQALVRQHYPALIIKPLKPSGKPSISELAKQIDRLIRQALDNQQDGDCVAVLHDADELTRPHGRDDYHKIEEVCRHYADQLKLIRAYDELEAWLLADEGVCKWLGIKAKNHDTTRQPSLELKNCLDKAGKNKSILQAVRHIDGTGHRHSPSLKQALALLENAPCTLDRKT